MPQTPEEKIAHAEGLKAAGNEFFKGGEWSKACQQYTRIFAFVNGLDTDDLMAEMPHIAAMGGGAQGQELSDQMKDRVWELKLSANANLAMAFLKREKYAKVLMFATRALDMDPNHVKSIFRRAQAQLRLGDLDGAKAGFDRVAELDPENKALPKERRRLREMLKRHNEKEKRKYQRIFGGAKSEANGDAEGETNDEANDGGVPETKSPS